jgi:UPF0176 protein
MATPQAEHLLSAEVILSRMTHNGEKFKIAAFYRFHTIAPENLEVLRTSLRQNMNDLGIVGTVILAEEGINSTICGPETAIDDFLRQVSTSLGVEIKAKFSAASLPPFRKIDVKIKPEIVTLKKDVDVSLGVGTHVSPKDWNDLISDPEVFLLDTRNQYEFHSGTFVNAVNPQTEKFSDLPSYVSANLDPEKHKKIAMFCTGGIRCEKFAPYMRSLGFESVFQLEGGILKYLEEIPVQDQRWVGECYVFDTRVTVDHNLDPGWADDLSQRD